MDPRTLTRVLAEIADTASETLELRTYVEKALDQTRGSRSKAARLAEGLGLNDCEQRALAAIDPDPLKRFVDSLHPCIQKVELVGGNT